MKTFLSISLALALGLAGTSASIAAAPASDVAIQHVRNATIKVRYGDQTFLVDPMLAAKGAYPGFPGTYRSHLRNPTVDLPATVESLLADVDTVIVSHTHLDHWDDAAQAEIPKALPILVQNSTDAALLASQGFTNVRVLDDRLEIGGVTVSRTGGRHGSEAMYAVPQLAELLGEVMGFVFEKPGAETIYVAGDTVWHQDVPDTIERYRPDVIVLNTGDARVDGFDTGIIMGKDDTLRVQQLAPASKIVAVHMDAVNHMTVSRADLRAYVAAHDIAANISIPEDGETIEF